MKRKGIYYPQYSYGIIRILSSMTYSDIIEYNIVGDTKTPLLRYIPFISKIKSGEKNYTELPVHELSVFLHIQSLKSIEKYFP